MCAAVVVITQCIFVHKIIGKVEMLILASLSLPGWKLNVHPRM